VILNRGLFGGVGSDSKILHRSKMISKNKW
jgi:hypothetical protein